MQIKQRTSRRSEPETTQPILSEAKGGVIPQIGEAILSLKTKRMRSFKRYMALAPMFARAGFREMRLIFFAGAGFFLAFPNPLIQIPPAALFMPASILLLSLETTSKSRALFLSFLCMFLGSSASLYWIAIPMHNFAGIPWIVGASCVMLLGAYYGLYGLLFSLALRFFTRRLGPYSALFACAASWGALELFRGHFLTGFPWLSLSSAFAGWPVLAQGAALLGMYGLSALYALIALLAALLFLSPQSAAQNASRAGPAVFAAACAAHSFLSGPAKTRRALLPALALLACLTGYGAYRLNIPWDQQGRIFLAAMAQGNINQEQKWTPENRAYILRRYLELSRLALDMVKDKYAREADLLLWPETAMPFVYELNPQPAASIRNFVSVNSVPLLFGVIGTDADAHGTGAGLVHRSSYNRILLLDQYAGRAGYYDKEHLVPFGEYVPPGLYVPFASEFLQGTGFSQGINEPVLMLPPKKPGAYSPDSRGGYAGEAVALGPLICYEVIFPELAQKRVEQSAAILVSVSNDAWFELSSAPLQHLQQAAMRCIEQGRYMLRSTNTGISASIDPAGRILNPGPLFEPRVQAEAVRALEEKTLYHKGYAWINGALWFMPCVLFLKALRRKNP
jgi:apolipoprotein N-acyltransferase